MTEELIHVRCITCNKVIGHKWEPYKKMISEGVPIKEALNTLGLTRPCCRMRMMNPFKIVTRANKQSMDDPAAMMESTFHRLSIATLEEAPETGALTAINKVTNLTIIPEEEYGIDLPDLPDLPEMPEVGIEREQIRKNRTYEAW